MDTTATARPASLRRVVSASAFGTLLQWYDFAIYAALATTIGSLFFPAENQLTELLVALATYGVGFVLRPFGAIVFGRYGDRAGRRNMLAVTMIVMGAASLVIACLPTYQTIGVAAPVLLVLARMLQGLGVGAEWSGGAVYLAEHAPTGKRGRYGGILQSADIAGFLLGSVSAAILVNLVSEQALHAYAWRIPFFFGALAAVVGYLIRKSLHDTPQFQELRESDATAASPVVESLRDHRRAGLTIVGIVFAITMYGYTISTFPSFLSGVADVPLGDALVTNSIALAVEVPLIVLMGMLSDRVGRKRLMVAGMVGLVVVTYPVYSMLSGGGGYATLLVGQLVFVVLYAVVTGPMAAMLAEMLPTRVRTTALSMSYNLSIALFGGTAPFVNTFLASRTGSATTPAYYLMASAVVTVVVLLTVRDRYREPLPG